MEHIFYAADYKCSRKMTEKKKISHVSGQAKLKSELYGKRLQVDSTLENSNLF